MPINHRKRWSQQDLLKIKNIASSLQSKQDMYKAASSLAKHFGRTESAICKKVEDANGWFWA
jgi:hypothetical protein